MHLRKAEAGGVNPRCEVLFCSIAFGNMMRGNTNMTDKSVCDLLHLSNPMRAAEWGLTYTKNAEEKDHFHDKSKWEGLDASQASFGSTRACVQLCRTTKFPTPDCALRRGQLRSTATLHEEYDRTDQVDMIPSASRRHNPRLQSKAAP